MDRHFDRDLKALEKRILDMGALCETMIQKTVKAPWWTGTAPSRKMSSPWKSRPTGSTWKSTKPW
jgi:hypothetical protein